VDLSTLPIGGNFGTTACGLFQAGSSTPLTDLAGQNLLTTLVSGVSATSGTVHLDGVVNLPGTSTDVVLGCTTDATSVTAGTSNLTLVQLGAPITP
jgi:hypothetical protein